MKKTQLIQPILAMLLLAVLFSCKKDEYTIEDKAVTGNITYVRTAFDITEVDPATQQPLTASVTMDGTGNISDMGDIHIVSIFKADMLTGLGYDFVTTYEGTSSSDSFEAITQIASRQTDGTILLTETIGKGKGKFSRIEGAGTTVVTLNQDQTAGTAVLSWTVTY